jgi:hypothetical protein
MKKIFSIITIFTSLFLTQSCFLFKPAQKTCPAYSLNEIEYDKTISTTAKIDFSTNETSM